MYHESFNKKPCQDDEECEVRHSGGDMCCLDLSSPLDWRWGKDSIGRKCCNNPRGVPVDAPHHDLSDQELRDLDKGLLYLRVYFLDLLVCDGLSYDTRR